MATVQAQFRNNDLINRAERLGNAFPDQGVTFDLDGGALPFPLDVVPRLFDPAKWSRWTPDCANGSKLGTPSTGGVGTSDRVSGRLRHTEMAYVALRDEIPDLAGMSSMGTLRSTRCWYSTIDGVAAQTAQGSLEFVTRLCTDLRYPSYPIEVHSLGRNRTPLGVLNR